MPRIDQVEITPTTLAKLGQAVDYRYRIRGKNMQDEDGADLVGTLGDLYRWLAQKHLEAAYDDDMTPDELYNQNPNRMEEEDLLEALTTLEQFDMLKLLYKDESGIN